MKSRKNSSPGCSVLVFNPLNSLVNTPHTDAQDEERTFVGTYLALADAALGKGAQDTSKPQLPRNLPPKAA